jgi:hypothetical protein
MQISNLEVLQSGAGFYVGRTYNDPEETGGFWFPYSQETHYFATAEEAKAELEFLADAIGEEVDVDVEEYDEFDLVRATILGLMDRGCWSMAAQYLIDHSDDLSGDEVAELSLLLQNNWSEDFGC